MLIDALDVQSWVPGENSKVPDPETQVLVMIRGFMAEVDAERLIEAAAKGETAFVRVGPPSVVDDLTAVGVVSEVPRG